MLTSLFLATALSASVSQASTGWPDLTEPPTGRVASKQAGDAALIITVEDYSIAPDIPGANQNGTDWFDWLLQARGVDNVKILQDRQVSKGSMLKQAELMAGFVQEGGRLWIVFVGHGVPSESSDEGLLVGWAADQTPASIAEHSISRQALLAAAERRLPADSEIVLVQDACFSGRTATEQLLPGVQPLKTVSAKLGSRTTVLSAAANNEYAGSLSDGTRPAFSYLLLGALRGWGDDTDGIVTASEAVGYAERAIQLTTNRSQTPNFEGPDVMLGRAARERGPNLAALQLVDKPIALVPTASAGSVAIQKGKGRDYRAMAQESMDADAALKEAIRRKDEADRQLQRERRERLDRAKSQVQAKAREDFNAIEPLLANPTSNARRVLQAYTAEYEGAVVSIDGETENVYIPQLSRVMAVLSRVDSSEPARPGRDLHDSDDRPVEARPALSSSTKIVDSAVAAIAAEMYTHHGLSYGSSSAERTITKQLVSGFLQAGFSRELLLRASLRLRDQRVASAAELNQKLGAAVARELSYSQ